MSAGAAAHAQSAGSLSAARQAELDRSAGSGRWEQRLQLPQTGLWIKQEEFAWRCQGQVLLACLVGGMNIGATLGFVKAVENVAQEYLSAISAKFS
jgi:hypothetical protein